MKIPAVALVIDVILVCTTTWAYFAFNPLGRDIARVGASVALARLPTRANSSEPVTLAHWYNYVAGTELGYYAQSNAASPVFLLESAWINSVILPRVVCDAIPHIVATWLRNLVAAYVLYFGVGSLWCIAIYWVGGARWFPKQSDRPSWQDLTDQMAVASAAMPLFTCMPTAGEWLMERGLTLAYYDVASVGGWWAAAAGLVAYGVFVVSVPVEGRVERGSGSHLFPPILRSGASTGSTGCCTRSPGPTACSTRST